MTRRRDWWLLVALLVIIYAPVSLRATGEYRTVEVESLKITIDTEWAPHAAPGYLPVRFDITNLGEARVIEIAGQGTRFFMASRSGSIGGMTIRQAVRLARGDRVAADDPGAGLRRQRERPASRFSRTAARSSASATAGSRAGAAPRPRRRSSSPIRPARLARPRPAGRARSRARRPLRRGARRDYQTRSRGSVTPGGGVTLPPLDFLLEPSRLPANWLGFTSVRAVVIGPREWEQLNDAQKSALLTWTACGGDLIFVDGDLRALFPAAARHSSAGSERRAQRLFLRPHSPADVGVDRSRGPG